MDYVFVLEDDPMYLREILEALHEVQENFEIKTFASLDAFSDFVKMVMLKGASALNPSEGDPARAVLLITRMEFIGLDRLSLLEKTRDFFMRRGLCTPSEPIRFVITVFDEEKFDLDVLKKPYIANVIFKPFDKLILQQHMKIAMPQVKGTTDALSGQKTTAIVEMLKAVQVESLNELGFTSRSNRSFKDGDISKYYSDDFASTTHRSVMAKMTTCIPHPQIPGEFLLGFRFFALDSVQIGNIRKKLRGTDSFGGDHKAATLPASGDSAVRILPTPAHPVIQNGVGGDANYEPPLFVIVDSSEDDARSLAGTLKRKVAGAEVVIFQAKGALYDDLHLSDHATKGIISAPMVTVDITRELVIKQCEPADATFCGEPLINNSLRKFMSKEEWQALGLWTMGERPEIKVRLSWAGNQSAIRFSRMGGKIYMNELDDNGMREFMRPFRRIKFAIRAIYVDSREIDPDHPTAWEAVIQDVVKDQGYRPACYLMANAEFTDDQEKTLSHIVDDIFFKPWDRIYQMQRLVFDVAGLKILEDPIQVHERPFNKEIRAATPVKISEISEAMLTINYYRPIELQSFRDFLLWQPNELEAPELSAVAQVIEDPGNDKTPARIRFTFFGVRDDQLKAVRLWIRNNYIHQKDRG